MDLSDNIEDTPIVEYTPDTVDEYIVVVNLPEDWEEVHNYIINENEIDGIPNRKIECINDKVFSLRSSVYMMSHEEAEILKTHPKVEDVELNPEKFPQSESLFSFSFGVSLFSSALVSLASSLLSSVSAESVSGSSISGINDALEVFT